VRRAANTILDHTLVTSMYVHTSIVLGSIWIRACMYKQLYRKSAVHTSVCSLPSACRVVIIHWVVFFRNSYLESFITKGHSCLQKCSLREMPAHSLLELGPIPHSNLHNVKVIVNVAKM
jgi:hypothetical protein